MRELLHERASDCSWDSHGVQEESMVLHHRGRPGREAVLSASLVFFFATQQELLDSTLALVTGLTAGLPTVTKIIDLLGGRRSAAGK